MARLIFLVGLPGAEKTKYGRRLAEETKSTLISLDKIRSQLRFVNEDISEDKIFTQCNNEIIKNLRSGHDCIYDATNIKARRRKHFVNSTLKNVECEKICVVMATPYKECIKNNEKRGCPIPNDVIKQMYHSWETPAHWEGWDKIWIHYDNPEWMTMNGTPNDFIKNTFWYDQSTPYHLNSLGVHSCRVQDYVRESLTKVDIWKRNEKWNKVNVEIAALLHDCGKPLTKERNGNKTTYYSHHNVGAYEALFFKYGKEIDPVYVSNLINYHMTPYFWEGQKSRITAIRRWGRDFFEDIMTIYEADEKGKR